MTEIDVKRECPKCRFVGEYSATSGFRGREPLMIWNMSWCGCQFTSDGFYRLGEGWGRWLPGERDGKRCE